MAAAAVPDGAIASWDVVRVDFPYADVVVTRRRPALVIATPSVTASFAILWLLMITSATHGRWPLDVAISDLRLGGLSHPCVVRTSKVTAIDSRLAIRIGQLAPGDCTKVAAYLGELLSGGLKG